jgi:NitT/TauT family transport system permease protein
MTRSILSRKLFRIALPAAFWLGVWQFAATAVHRQLLLPAPGEVLFTLRALAVTAEFWGNAGASLLRILAGFSAGVALGALLAVLTSFFTWADLLLSPAIKVVRATPVVSFIILVLLWVKTGQVPGVISALMVLPVIWGSLSAGIARTDPLLLELASAYRFGRGKTFRLIYFPSVLPFLASGCDTSLGLAWKAGVAAEVLCLPQLAVGTRVYYSKIYLETPSLFAWTMVLIVLSFALEWGLGAAFRRLGKRGKRL